MKRDVDPLINENNYNHFWSRRFSDSRQTNRVIFKNIVPEIVIKLLQNNNRK